MDQVNSEYGHFSYCWNFIIYHVSYETKKNHRSSIQKLSSLWILCSFKSFGNFSQNYLFWYFFKTASGLKKSRKKVQVFQLRFWKSSFEFMNSSMHSLSVYFFCKNNIQSSITLTFRNLTKKYKKLIEKKDNGKS